MVGGCGLDSCAWGQGSVISPHEHGNESSGSINGGEFDRLSEC